MKKQPEVTIQTRENLIQAFWSLYCEKKIEGITVKAITEKAGYHRSTFYEYFTDVYDVLTQLEESLLEDKKESVIKGLETGQQDDLIQQVADLYETKGNYLSVLLGENGNPLFVKKIKTVMRPVLMDKFGLSENEAHTSYICEFVSSAIIGTMTYWYQNGKSISSVELLSMVRSMLEDGVWPMIRKYATNPDTALIGQKQQV